MDGATQPTSNSSLVRRFGFGRSVVIIYHVSQGQFCLLVFGGLDLETSLDADCKTPRECYLWGSYGNQNTSSFFFQSFSLNR